MWTPKRIVLLVLGFALFLTGYFTYSIVLGGIDGLPPLPQELLTKLDVGTEIDPPRRHNLVDDKLGKAFGLECRELKRDIKLELSRNNMVLASDDFKINPEGRLVLRPFSVAMFGKPKNDGRYPEINTIRSDVAILTFDRPIPQDVNPNNLNGRKIVGAELTGNIEVVNNRRTARRDDDIELFVRTGPLYYEEARHLIWTYDEVHVTDRHIDSPPNQVWGKGMELELQVEAETPQPPTAHNKPHQDTITGVKRITLQANVVMDLFVDGSSGFINHSDKNGPAKPQPDGKVVNAAPQKDEKDAAKAKEPAEKSNLHITTPGRFNYLFYKDYEMAHFEVTPGVQPAPGGPKPRDVTVVRKNKLGTDQLFCQVLDLKLTRNEAEKKPGAAPPVKPAGGDQRDEDQNFSIEWVHATADENSKVTLTSDAEKLIVTEVNDLMHEAKTGITILKGNPNLRADKDDNVLVTRQLTIEEIKIVGSDKTYQKATALGPGKIDLADKKAAQANKRPQHALWNDTLISTKDERTLTAKGEMQDMLILTGAGRFVDDEHNQTLQGDTLKVWLISAGDKKVDKATPAQPSNPGQTAGQAGGAKADHLEAIGNVLANSRELNIHDTGRLVVWFKDAPPTTLPTALDGDGKVRTTVPPLEQPSGVLPPPVPKDAPSTLPLGPVEPTVKPGSKPVVTVTPIAPSTPPPTVAPALPGVAAKPAPKPEEPARPIDLSARSVEAWVLREETKNTLEKLWSEGTVHVHQAPAKVGDQPVDITGDTLNMIYHPDGDLLVVTGNEENLARLQMDKILILGPEVNIDQAANKAWVVGAGAMRIDSNTTLSGKALDKSEPLTIQWQKSMLVHGRYAEFNVGIQATQDQQTQDPEDKDQARMACNTLRVNFDRPISLKEGNKGEQAPKVQTLLCDQNARVEQLAYEHGKLVKYERLEAPTISESALQQFQDDEPRKPGQTDAGNEMRATGPGWFRTVGVGGPDPLAPPTDPKQKPQPTPQTSAKPPAPKPAPKPNDDQLKLTVVEFAGSMYGNSQKNFVSFRKNVRVVNMPVDNPFMDLDIDVTLAKLPEGAMYLSCQHLEVYTREEKGKKYQEMHAYEQAVVQSNEFWGRAAIIHFDEAKDQVIFDGNGGKATLYKMKQVGVPPEQIRGTKIIYWRKTGAFTGENLESLQAN